MRAPILDFPKYLIYNNPLKIITIFTKANLISTIVAAVWSFMGGFLFWGIFAEDFMNNHLGTATGVGKEMPDLGLLVGRVYKKVKWLGYNVCIKVCNGDLFYYLKNQSILKI